LRVEALSLGEWNYLRGLFLTDGRAKLGLSRVKKRNKIYPHYGIYFYLQGNEGELARKVQWLLARAGLKSRLDKDPCKNMLVVSVLSKALFNFLPTTQTLERDLKARNQFFDDSGLTTVKGGVPFLAGLMDGDGGCHVYTRVKRNGLPYLEKSWRFSQYKFQFLIDYIETIMRSIVSSDGRSTSRYLDAHKGSWSPNPLPVISFLRNGIDALLALGIDKYSWKVCRWLKRTEELSRWKSSYLTAPEAAKLLHVDRATIRAWIETRKLKNTLRRGRWFYIPVGEVERLKKDVIM
jgi:excisionase family DNA binding protein